VLTKSLTVVLPIHNGESRLRNHVHELLEVGSELTSQFKILIVDDGSTDATFEVAEELVAHYPQVGIRRHRHRRGLGPVIEYVRRNVRSDAVIFHDGITPIDYNQMRNVWRRWIAGFGSDNNLLTAHESQPHDVCDFANLPAIHAAMERAHGQLLGFHLIVPQLDTLDASCDDHVVPSDSPRTDRAHLTKPAGVGQIPRMPRPKFLSALAQFALGE
jgi:glycosyltransferase involved in cell wall biosynthesis